MREILVKRIKCDKTTIRRRRQFQPCPVIIQLLCDLGRYQRLGALTEHTVGKHGLQRLCLMPLACSYQHIETDNLLRACPNNVQRNSILHLPTFRTTQFHFAHRSDRRRCGTIQHHALFPSCPFKNSSAFAKSSGVSIPIVSTWLMPTLMVYPFSNQRSCSNDSATSRLD